MATHRPDLGNASGGSEMTNTNKNEKSPKITKMVMVMLLLTIPSRDVLAILRMTGSLL